MKTVSLTEYERSKVTAAINSMMHFHQQQKEKADKDGHPTIAKRFKLAVEEYEKLLEKFQ